MTEEQKKEIYQKLKKDITENKHLQNQIDQNQVYIEAFEQLYNLTEEGYLEAEANKKALFVNALGWTFATLGSSGCFALADNGGLKFVFGSFALACLCAGIHSGLDYKEEKYYLEELEETLKEIDREQLKLEIENNILLSLKK